VAAEPTIRPRLARAILFAAALLGVAGDSLLRDGPSGVAFPLWIGVLALNGVSLVWKDGRRLGLEAASWLAAAFVFSLGLAWRNADQLQALDVLAVATCLALAGVAIFDPQAALGAETLRRLAGTVLRLVRVGISGFAPLALTVLHDPARARRTESRWLSIARSAGIAAVLLVVFGALLRSADPIFAAFVAVPDFDAAELVGHVMFSAFLAWLVAGWVRAALHSPSERVSDHALPFELGMSEVTTALGSLVVLFALYVASQIAWFFGGERFLRAHTGLTVAAYARSGFFQMVWVVALVLPVLLGTRAMLRAGAAGLARRHTALSIPLIALLGVMIASAVLRLRLYVNYYGLTIDRFYPLVFMGWLTFVLAWTAATVLRGRTGFVRGVVLSGFAVLAALNVSDPDAVVARVDVARVAQVEAPGAEKLDVAHLAELRGAAVPIAVGIVLDERRGTPAAARCDAARTLLRRWWANGSARQRSEGESSWRFWNADDRLANESVHSNAQRLQGVEHRTCGGRAGQ
jgi:hypothetical protein